MTRAPDLDDKSRLLVVVPHPDDETLATGGLIQMALAAGSKLRVVIATDGDNNPWPQRWIEKRLRIDASARKRWGARRRGEVAMALARLGVAEQETRYYGWPDQGLSALLMHGSTATDQLAGEILDFAPTVLVAPSLSDLHPDHNALGTMLDIALSSGPFARIPRLDFVVHGSLPDVHGLAVPVNDAYADRKLHALQAHTSQLALSGKRMTRLCKRREWFESAGLERAGGTDPVPLAWQWQISPLRIRLQRHAVFLIARTGTEIQR
ncbi:PIG-L deacetylase family protein, partial [Dokdonella sp.]|uniref:PIG-L deacetylase family protein n=1 Tax=Dokdonella sp. TaxID=2291710 RepID=UPI003C31EA01